MRYGWLPLFGFFTACAVLFALSLRSDPTAAELKRDLELPAMSQVWLVGDAKPDRVIAVSETNDTYKLFSAARVPVDSGVLGRWFISFTVLDALDAENQFKLPFQRRQNHKGPGVSQLYDHFPTDDEIHAFLIAYKIDWAL
ncbi:MAG: hypothetical protein EA381_09470 [Planctomycetaceae bacterium]|nr:MAG: hypothetical protein EA381_09470 [Planctomycetaceae bacterium]